MNISLGVVMDPIHGINVKKDTTLALLLAAQAQGWSLFYMEMSELALVNGTATARQCPLKVHDDAEHWFDLGEPVDRPMAELDCILMRKDPPFDSEFIYATYILEAAEREGTLVVNKPQSLRDCNEKIFATQFPECTPPLLVSRDPERLRAFHQQHGDVIYKPLDGMGGTGIFRARKDDPNVSVIIETLSELGTRTIMVQRYIPQITAGDKRILVIDGEPVPFCLARVPAKGETRGNFAAGGLGIVEPLSERDLAIVSTVAPALRAKGVVFAGLELIVDTIQQSDGKAATFTRNITA